MFALSIVGLAGVFYLAYASFVVLKTVCLLCVATYVAMIGLFVSAAAGREESHAHPARAARRRPVDAAPHARRRWRAVVAFAAAAVVAIRWFPAEAVTAAAAATAGQAAAPAAQAAAPAAAGRQPPRRRSSSSSSPRSSACR